MKTRHSVILIILFVVIAFLVFVGVAHCQQPIRRNPWSTNADGTPVIGSNVIAGTALNVLVPFTNTVGNAHFQGGKTYFSSNIAMQGLSSAISLASSNAEIHYDQGDDILTISNVFDGTALDFAGGRFRFRGLGITASNAILAPISYNVNPLEVYNNANAASLVVRSNGSVGITAPPYDTSYLFHIFNSSTNFSRAGVFEHEYSSGDGVASSFILKTRKNSNAGSGYGSGFLFAFEDDASGNKWLGRIAAVRDSSDTTGDMVFYVNNNLNEVMRLDTSGYVGIGTNLPSAKLTVKDDVANSDAAAIDISNDLQTWRLQTYGSGNDTFRLFDVTQNKAAITISTNHENMIVVTNGRVGIATATPSYPLSVSGIIQAESVISSGTTPYFYMSDASASSDDWLLVSDTNYFTIKNNTDSRNDLQIDGDGNVTIFTNLTAMTNVYVGGTTWLTNGLGWSRHPTNAALNGAVLNLNVAYQLTNAAGNITFTGLTGTDDRLVQKTTLFITTAGTITVTIPVSWRTYDADYDKVLYPSSNMVLTVTRYGNILTNAELTPMQ